MNQKQKQGILLAFPIFTLFLCISGVGILCLSTYQVIEYEHISALCEIILESNPEEEQQILAAVKEYHTLTEQDVNGNQYLSKYGYHADEFCKGLSRNIYVLFLIMFLIIASIFHAAMITIWKSNKKRIEELTDYLEKINIGTGGTIIQTEEDDFSHLQDEIYKTVTTLYQMKETAIIAQKRFAENLANIAHQLKTPITAAFLSLQLMKEVAPNQYAEQVEKQLKRLNRLEESLLLLSKIDAGILPLTYTSVDIYTALTLAAENLNDLLVKNHSFVEIPEKGCVEFCGDLEWTMEALMNLIKNCMEHSREGGCIHCDYTNNPIYVEILIWDEGTGFEPEDIPHLFERFYRGKRATENGIGIGLSLARSIFELQNGTITARNLPNGGACFEIRIYSH